MRGTWAFFKKELLEAARTHRLLILLAAFAFFGMMSPLTAKLTPQLLSSLMPEGMNITLPSPTARESWEQFFKNISQMGLIAFAIVYSGAMAGELSKGTLVLLLTRGMPRAGVTLAKYAMMALLWTACYALALCLTLAYTAYLFPGAAPPNLTFSIACLWLYGLFLFAVELLAASLTRNAYACLLIVAGAVVALMIVDIWPALSRWNPYALTHNMPLIQGLTAPGDLLGALAVAVAATSACVAGSILAFRRRLV